MWLSINTGNAERTLPPSQFNVKHSQRRMKIVHKEYTSSASSLAFVCTALGAGACSGSSNCSGSCSGGGGGGGGGGSGSSSSGGACDAACTIHVRTARSLTGKFVSQLIVADSSVSMAAGSGIVLSVKCSSSMTHNSSAGSFEWRA